MQLDYISKMSKGKRIPKEEERLTCLLDAMECTGNTRADLLFLYRQEKMGKSQWQCMEELIRIIQQVQPDEIYNLAAQSHVKVSFDVPEYTAEADAIGTLRMLEAVRILGMEKKTRIYQASTSELFGLVQEVPQKETTPFYPRSPYGVAKHTVSGLPRTIVRATVCML